MTTTANIALTQIVNNEGFELPSGRVNANPRFIRDEEYENLLASLRESDMTDIMPLKVFLHDGQYIAIGGNMRLRALRELGAYSVDCIVIPDTYTADMLNKAIIIDNATHGEWDIDMLANDWDTEKLREWGVDIPAYVDKETSKLSGIEINSMYHEPQRHPHLTLKDCIDTTKYEQKMAAIREMGFSDEQVAIMEIFARRFIRIDFESVANYYAFNATEKEKDAIERLRLVLVDAGGVLTLGWKTICCECAKSY